MAKSRKTPPTVATSATMRDVTAAVVRAVKRLRALGHNPARATGGKGNTAIDPETYANDSIFQRELVIELSGKIDWSHVREKLAA